MPAASMGGGVRAVSEMDAGFRLGECLGEFQIGGCVIDGVRRGKENDRFHCSTVEIFREGGDIAKPRCSGLVCLDTFSFTDVSKSEID